MIHFVYETTNLVNGKKYIGKHSTNSLDDSYLGSGVLLKKAIKKHGRENFKRVVLAFFTTSDEALEFERRLVSVRIVESDDFYNLKIGGVPSNQFHVNALRGSSKLTNPSIQKQVDSRKRNHAEKMNGIMREIKNNLHLANSELVQKFKISESTLCRMKKKVKAGLDWCDPTPKLPHGLKGTTKDVAQWRIIAAKKTCEKLKSREVVDSPLIKITTVHHSIILKMLNEGKSRKEIQNSLKLIASKVTLNRHITKIANKYNIPINERRS